MNANTKQKAFLFNSSVTCYFTPTGSLLLYAYWKHPYYLPHWTDEIDNFRLELSLLFRSQVIYNHALERFGYCYQKARRKASRKSGLTLPVDCPWTIEKILDEDWFPG